MSDELAIGDRVVTPFNGPGVIISDPFENVDRRHHLSIAVRLDRVPPGMGGRVRFYAPSELQRVLA